MPSHTTWHIFSMHKNLPLKVYEMRPTKSVMSPGATNWPLKIYGERTYLDEVASQDASHGTIDTSRLSPPCIVHRDRSHIQGSVSPSPFRQPLTVLSFPSHRL